MKNKNRHVAAPQLTRREALALMGAGVVTLLHSGCSREPALPRAKTLDDALPYASLMDVAAMIESGELSPVALTELMLARIETLDARLHSYATVMADSALATARTAEEEIAQGNYRGPLHGIPVAVKDLCYTQGVPTMGGHVFLSDFRPEFNATVVERLEQAGAVLLGKLNLTEGAMGGYHRGSRIPVNPWRDDLWAGASSSGSGVATASGLCFASLGTDTGGSIRFPSMANGIVGLKPTYGRVSRYGVLPLGETLDHVGPMTRRVADAAAVLNVIAGHDANDPTSLQAPVPDMLAEIDRGIDGVRFGYDSSYASDGVEPGLVAAIETALGRLESLGGRIVDVRMPSFSPEQMGETWFSICAYEAAAAHATNLAAHAEEYGDYFREFLAFGESVTDEQYEAATAVRNDFSAQFRDVLGQVDAVVCPSGGVPFPLPHEIQYGGLKGFDDFMPKVRMHFTIPADFAGTPTLSQRCGFSDEGLPYTIQFMGSALSEPALCKIGYAYEAATDWHNKNPI